MTTIVDSSGVTRTVASIEMVDAVGSLRAVAKIQVVDAAGTLRDLVGGGGGGGSFSAIATPGSVVGNTVSGGSVQVTTTLATATATGGTAPYTYSWTNPLGDWEAVYPDNNQTQFRSPPLGPGDISDTDFTCTITDALGATADTNTVHARARNLG